MPSKKELYWERYLNSRGKVVWGYFNSVFSKELPIGFAIDNKPQKPRWKTTMAVACGNRIFEFAKLKEAKEYIESAYLCWVMNGGSLNNKEK